MDSVSPGDSTLVQKVLSGERAAYAALVRRYEARIQRLCVSLLKNEADAKDAAQETFIKAYQSLSQFRQDASFYTWIYRIASNHCLSLLRSRSRRPSESLDSLLEKEGSSIEQFFSKAPDFRESLAAGELLDKILSHIKPNHRLILTLREAEGLSYREIADVLKLSEEAVKSELYRARQEIQEKFRHFLPPSGV